MKDFDYSKMKEVSEDSIEAKLYQIIDNIDTGFDMFHPKMEGFEKFVEKQIDSKKKLIVSDGYKLFYWTDDESVLKESDPEIQAPVDK